MAESDSKRHWLPIIIPIVLIVLLLPVAVVIGLRDNDDEDNETTDKPDPAQTNTVEVEGAAPSGPVVIAQDLQFLPQNITVGTGEVVTFQNPELSRHEVDFGDGDTYGLPGGESFEWSEEEPGTYEYICLVHQEMTGSITVSPTNE